MKSEDYSIIIRRIITILNIPIPNETLIRNVSKFINNFNYDNLINELSKDELYNYIVEEYINSIKNNNENINYKEYKPLLDVKTDDILVPKHHYTHILIDSRYRNITNSENTYINKFEYVILPKSNNVDPVGKIFSFSNLVNIIQFKIGSIILPYSEELALLNYSREITLSFTNLNGNSIITNTPFHFKFNYSKCDYNNNLIQLIPTIKKFRFNPPLRSLDSLAVQFNDPFLPIMFDSDRMYPSSINYIATDGRIIFSNKHKLNTDDIIIINQFNTNDDIINQNIINQITNKKGVKITKINDYIISTNIDFSSIILPDNSFLPEIIFQSKTFRFPIIIKYKTNSII
jgi:hypothetical protein